MDLHALRRGAERSAPNRGIRRRHPHGKPSPRKGRAEMKNFFTQNIGWKLLSLAAAVVLWISVASEPELATFISVRVEYKNLSPDIEIDSDVVETVLLEVRGPSGEMGSLPEERRRYAVVLD